MNASQCIALAFLIYLFDRVDLGLFFPYEHDIKKFLLYLIKLAKHSNLLFIVFVHK